jgi:ankyrin repeat protein
VQDKSGTTALDLAVSEGSVDVVRMLVDAGAQIVLPERTVKTTTALHIAVEAKVLSSVSPIALCSGHITCGLRDPRWSV